VEDWRGIPRHRHDQPYNHHVSGSTLDTVEPQVRALHVREYMLTALFCSTKFYHLASTGPLDEIRGRYGIPSLAIGASRQGKLETDAVGLRKRWSEPSITTEDKFHLGSNTKAMTATLGAMLLKTFFKSWDSTLYEMLPNLAGNMSAEHRHTTLAMLTAHRSGITDEWMGKDLNLTAQYYGQLLSPKDTRKLIAETLLSRPPNVNPGKEFIYSNTGYIVFGYVLEHMTGIPWEDLIRVGLFTPLGMTNCGFGVPPESEPTAIDNPWPHQKSPFGPIPIPPVRGDNPPALGPAGTVHCSMSDYAKFLQLHIDGYKGRSTRLKLLGSQDFLRLHSPYPGPGTQYTSGGWGRGWDDRVGTYLTHEGSNTMYYHTAFVTPDVDSAYMAMTNIGYDDASNALWEAINGMIDGNLLGPEV
jgi:D-alanyl-D-alanine carboxypeptidase